MNCLWDGGGDEPPEWESAWLAAAWQLVDARRAELVGQFVHASDRRWRIVTPARCPLGHPLDRPRGALAGWLPCRCGGHQSWSCQMELGGGCICEATVVHPQWSDECHVQSIG